MQYHDIPNPGDESISSALTKANCHYLEEPFPILTGSLAHAKGLISVVIKAKALSFKFRNCPETVRFSIRPEGADISETQICEVSTRSKGWHLPLDGEFHGIAKFKQIARGFNNQPASNLIEIHRNFHFAKGSLK